MGSMRDKAGRPIVVVTGSGLVTPLGAGKADNWRRLTAGESGIRKITRFGTDSLKTKVAGTVDFIPLEPYSAPALSERLAELATEEAIAESGLGSRGHFPGPLFLAVAPIEIDWPQRELLANGSRANDVVSYDDLLRAAATGRYQPYHARFQFGSVGDPLAAKFGTQGSPISPSTACSSGARPIQLGLQTTPPPPTDPPLSVTTDGSVNPQS